MAGRERAAGPAPATAVPAASAESARSPDDARGRAARRRRIGEVGRAVVGPLEVERGGEIAADCAPPAGDVALDQIMAARCEAALDELDQRGVVEYLGADPA